ncbi:MAG: acetate kinase [Elusimicrobia bacterium RIFOXYB2_FULL_49_7]|nr:MAG: acetate kinase [Elusimicrobia bacterium RIFOXYB2_FULL_49_7]
MNVLVMNCGSSSIKFQFIEIIAEKLICKGGIERIGTTEALLTYEQVGKGKIKEIVETPDHSRAIESIINLLLSPQRGVIKEKSEIDGIGHRVVHGGEKFSESVLVTCEVEECIKEFCKFAPLHNPHNLKGIETCKDLLPGIPQIAVFDTAFHHKMPEKAYLYALPYSVYQKFGIRRYGFHGTSHKYVAEKAVALIGKPVSATKIITCHLGNGCSMAAVLGGVSVDTSMGFTPLEGLVMGTRCGDIDPAVIPYLMEKENLSVKEIDSLMNKQSGLLGISGTGNDMRELTVEALAGSHRHKLAIDIFCQRVKKYIGAYIAVMGGLDALVFTGGIGENAALIREKICDNMDFMGIRIEGALNQQNEESIGTGKTKVFIIGTNEELMIARDVRTLVQNLK